MSVKQVIVMRKDLNMRKGKMVAQGAHASLTVFFDKAKMPPYDAEDEYATILITLPDSQADAITEWFEGDFTKICVGVDSEQELLEIYMKAREECLPCSLITDAGRTEFSGKPTKTCIAIGPAPSEEIDKITGHLKLL